MGTVRGVNLDVDDVLIALGGAALVAGAALVSVAAGLITLGVVLLAIAVIGTR